MSLTLPLALSSTTELTMETLMDEAISCHQSGKYKMSYELYIEALSSAINEFKQLQFIDQYVLDTNSEHLSSVFSLAHTCLRHAKSISTSNPLSTPPPIPPKPNNLSARISPPPLPRRPNGHKLKAYYSSDNISSMKKQNSASSSCSYNSEEEYEEETDTSTNKSSIYKQQQKRKPSSTSLKVIVNDAKPLSSKMMRRSSTSNLSMATPSSPLTSVSNPLNAVKSFLSLPSNRVGSGGMSSSDSMISGDELFLLANSTVDPNHLVHVQTSQSDLTASGNSAYLPSIPQAPLVTVYKSLQSKLETLKNGNTNPSTRRITDMQSTLNRVRNIHMSATTVPSVLQFHPIFIAYQLTLIDSTLFRNIPIEAILIHTPKTPHPAIVASTDFFNYLTRLIEHSILLQQDASGRAQHMNHWIKVAGKCQELKNYQTLKAVTCALATPPVQRLKRSWSYIPKKSLNLLEELSEFMSESSNYGNYRTRIGLEQQQQLEKQQEHQEQLTEEFTNISGGSKKMKKSLRKNSFSEPTVPFLGLFIHDMTYLIAAATQRKNTTPTHNSEWKKEPPVSAKTDIEKLKEDVRVVELLKLFKELQRSPPYSPNLLSSMVCIKDLLSKNSRKRKLSHAIRNTSNTIKKTATTTPAPLLSDEESNSGEISIEMQQCLVTQYLLTRSWVSEKTVDELSILREPTKAQLAKNANTVESSPQQPIMSGSVSVTTERSSSGSTTTSSNNSSRPISLEDEHQQQPDDTNSLLSVDGESKKSMTASATTTGFWLFGRKSVDGGYKDNNGTLHRSPRHFSFEDVNSKQQYQPCNNMESTKMQREGSQGSLSIFRKDFWKNSNLAVTTPGGSKTAVPFMQINSEDPSVAVTQKSTTEPSPSTSADYFGTAVSHELAVLQKSTSHHPLENSNHNVTMSSGGPRAYWDE